MNTPETQPEPLLQATGYAAEKCQVCRGDGKIGMVAGTDRIGPVTWTIKCDACNGTGWRHNTLGQPGGADAQT